MDFWKPYVWRIVFTLAGLAMAISFIWLGFNKTLLILLCCFIGYLVGAKSDKKIYIIERLRSMLNRI